MTKEVLISIKGLQFNEGESDNIEIITPGTYYKKNDNHYVVFEEILEGHKEPTKNMIKFNQKEMTLTKRGLVNVHMLFEENKKNITNYGTPFGNIIIGIEAGKIALTEKEKQMELLVSYALEVNYEHFADCNIRMNIREKGTEGFSLQE